MSGKAFGKRFVTGSKGLWSGLGIIAMTLVAGVFWGGLAWAVWSGDMVLLGIYMRILGAVMAAVLPAAILLGLISAVYKRFVRPR